MKLDLHCHSEYSFDSTETIETILACAEEKGIDVLAICDHNEIAGSLKAQQQSQTLQIISGIEIDCFYQDKILHLLGYGCDLTRPIFAQLQQHYLQELNRIASKRISSIEQRYRIKLDLAKIKALASGKPITNVAITQHLLQDFHHPELEPYQTGSKKENPLAAYYWDHLAIGKWGYVELDLPQCEEVIQLIHESGGVCICAHPKMNIGHDEIVIDELVKRGIDGFEVYCSYHDEQDRLFYRDIAKRYDLCFTCGSDFHGKTKPNIKLGQHHYEEDGAIILDKLNQRKEQLQCERRK